MCVISAHIHPYKSGRMSSLSGDGKKVEGELEGNGGKVEGGGGEWRE